MPTASAPRTSSRSSSYPWHDRRQTPRPRGHATTPRRGAGPALVQQLPRVTYVNGDQVDFLDIVFRCRWVSGDPHPADGELSEVGFYDLAAMGDIDDARVRKIALAVAEDDPAHFRGGRTAR